LRRKGQEQILSQPGSAATDGGECQKVGDSVPGHQLDQARCKYDPATCPRLTTG